MAIRKEKNKHLTDDQRLALEAALRERKSLSQIKRETGIPRSTIKREIMNRRVESTKTFYGRRFNPCVHRGGCQALGMCGRPDCTRRCASCALRPGAPRRWRLPRVVRLRGPPVKRIMKHVQDNGCSRYWELRSFGEWEKKSLSPNLLSSKSPSSGSNNKGMAKEWILP